VLGSRRCHAACGGRRERGRREPIRMQHKPQRPRRNGRRLWVWVVGLLLLLLLLGGALWLGLASPRGRGAERAAQAGGAAAAAVGPVAATDAKVPDGPLTIYCGRPEPLMAPLFDRFGAETGVSFIVRYADTWGLEEELVAEGTRTPAAVFIAQDAAALGALSRKGLLRELPMEIVQGVDPRFTGTQARHDWVGLSARARAVVYDPAVTPAAQLPRTLEEVAEEKYQGRFGIAPANDSFQAQLALYRVLRGDDALRDLLTKVKKNRPHLYVNNAAVVQAVARGEIAFGLVNHYSLWREAGTLSPGRLAVTFMPGAGVAGFVNATGVGVLSSDPRALELIRFLLSRPAQERFAEETYEYPLAKGMTAQQGLPPLASLRMPTFDFADIAAVLDEADRATRRAGLMP
jgi:iron(III) transport system substrate-binding protein